MSAQDYDADSSFAEGRAEGIDCIERILAHLYRLPCAQPDATDAQSRGYQLALADVRCALQAARNEMEIP